MELKAVSSKCSGCRACLVACAMSCFEENNLRKAALAVIPHFPNPGVFEVRTCNQCGACAEVCPADAIPKNQRGVYEIDPELCIGCMSCLSVCPNGVVFSHPDREAPFMCGLCGDCVKVCGTNVLWIE